jgi:hypothetical protein
LAEKIVAGTKPKPAAKGTKSLPMPVGNVKGWGSSVPGVAFGPWYFTNVCVVDGKDANCYERIGTIQSTGHKTKQWHYMPFNEGHNNKLPKSKIVKKLGKKVWAKAEVIAAEMSKPVMPSKPSVRTVRPKGRKLVSGRDKDLLKSLGIHPKANQTMITKGWGRALPGVSFGPWAEENTYEKDGTLWGHFVRTGWDDISGTRVQQTHESAINRLSYKAFRRRPNMPELCEAG